MQVPSQALDEDVTGLHSPQGDGKWCAASAAAAAKKTQPPPSAGLKLSTRDPRLPYIQASASSLPAMPSPCAAPCAAPAAGTPGASNAAPSPALQPATTTPAAAAAAAPADSPADSLAVSTLPALPAPVVLPKAASLPEAAPLPSVTAADQPKQAVPAAGQQGIHPMIARLFGKQGSSGTHSAEGRHRPAPAVFLPVQVPWEMHVAFTQQQQRAAAAAAAAAAAGRNANPPAPAKAAPKKKRAAAPKASGQGTPKAAAKRAAPGKQARAGTEQGQPSQAEDGAQPAPGREWQQRQQQRQQQQQQQQQLLPAWSNKRRRDSTGRWMSTVSQANTVPAPAADRPSGWGGDGAAAAAPPQVTAARSAAHAAAAAAPDQAEQQPADLLSLLLETADCPEAAATGLTHGLGACFLTLLDTLPPDLQAAREARLRQLLRRRLFAAASEMMATALRLAGVV